MTETFRGKKILVCEKDEVPNGFEGFSITTETYNTLKEDGMIVEKDISNKIRHKAKTKALRRRKRKLNKSR